MQATLWSTAATAAAVAAIAALADRRRTRRRDLDRVGWIPWPAILIAAIFIGAVCAALALKT
jgi:hypothetical protein